MVRTTVALIVLTVALVSSGQSPAFATKDPPKADWTTLNHDIVKDPRSGWPHYKKARAYSDALEDAPALDEYNLAIKLDPNQAIFHYFRGMSLASTGKKREAIEDLEIGFECGRKSKAPVDLHVMGDCLEALEPYYIEAGKTKKLIEDWKILCPKSNFAGHWARLASLEIASDNFAAGRADLALAVKYCTADTESLTNIASCYEKMGDFSQAAENYTKAINNIIKSNQSFAPIRRYSLYASRARCYRRIKNIAAAMKDEKTFTSYRDGAFEIAPFRSGTQ